MTYSFQDSPGSNFGPPIENEKNHIFQNKCTTYIHGICGLRDFAIPRTALVIILSLEGVGGIWSLPSIVVRSEFSSDSSRLYHNGGNMHLHQLFVI